MQEYLPAISHKRQIISTTRDVTSQKYSDLSLGRRPLSKSEECFEVTYLVVENGEIGRTLEVRLFSILLVFTRTAKKPKHTAPYAVNLWELDPVVYCSMLVMP